MNKTAFVTGATGFLGINLVKELKAQQWEVTALHRPTSNLKYLQALDVSLAPGTLDDLDSLVSALPQQADAVFHVAASTNLWSKYNQEQYRTNVTGTKNVIRAARANQAKRFIHTSSIAAYGFHDFSIDEKTSSNALTSGINYFTTKFQAEEAVKAAVTEGLDAVIINPAHIVGPYDTQNWVQMFKSVHQGQLPGVPNALGRFTYAPEVAKAHIQAYDHGITGDNYLLGGVQASMLDFINAIETAMKKPLTKKTTPSWVLQLATKWYQLRALFSDNEPLLTPEKTKLITHNVLCDDAKAQKQLNFQVVPLQSMVQSTYEWLQQEQIL